MESTRVRELRKKKGLTQARLAAEVGISQQRFSQSERDISNIKVDILIKLAQYFNVTTDYLLGLSDVKRGLQEQIQVNETLDEYYEIVKCIKQFDESEVEFLQTVINGLEKLHGKKKGNNK